MASEQYDLTEVELHLSGLTEEDHNILVASALKLMKSVVKLVEMETEQNKDTDRLGLGTAFVVHRSGLRSLLLSCAHVINDLDPTTFRVRFTAEGENAPLECAIKVIALDKNSDLLLLSIEEGPAGLEALEFSMEPIKKHDKVAIIGFSYMDIPDLCAKTLIINEPSIMTGRILVDSFDMKSQRPKYSCRRGKVISDARCTAGNSGSPVIRAGKVIAVHCLADAAWREGATVNRVLKFLKAHLKKRDDDDDNITRLLEEIAERETALQTSKSKRKDDGTEAPETSYPSRWGKTFKRKPKP